MQLLKTVHSEQLRDEIVRLMEENGIPVHVVYAGAITPFPTPYRAKIFVCLDHHVDDAVRLLKDPSHRVKRPVNIGTYRFVERSPVTRDVLIRWGWIVLGFVVLFSVAVLGLLYRSGRWF